MTKYHPEITSPAENTPESIEIYALDMDGCIFSKRYIHEYAGKHYQQLRSSQTTEILFDIPSEEQRNYNALVSAHEDFFTHINLQKNPHAKQIFMLASNRQSIRSDWKNSFIVKENEYGEELFVEYTASAFETIELISRYFNASLDTVLLADICNKKLAGTSFSQAKQWYLHWRDNGLGERIFPSKAGACYDSSKVVLMYVQIQKIAHEYPNKKVVFYLYDDTIPILQKLSNFYQAFPHLIPANVALYLEHYNGTSLPQHYSTIQGSGEIDNNYRKTSIEMLQRAYIIAQGNTGFFVLEDSFNTAQVLFCPHQDNQGDVNEARYCPQKYSALREKGKALNSISLKNINIDVATHLMQGLRHNPDLLESRALLNSQHAPNASVHLHIHGLDAVKKALKAFKATAVKTEKTQYSIALRKAIKLYKHIHNGLNELSMGTIDEITFKQISLKAIEKTRPDLEALGWDAILGNMVLAIIGLGVFYITACATKYCFTGHFLFFLPEATRKITELKGSIQSIQVKDINF